MSDLARDRHMTAWSSARVCFSMLVSRIWRLADCPRRLACTRWSSEWSARSCCRSQLGNLLVHRSFAAFALRSDDPPSSVMRDHRPQPPDGDGGSWHTRARRARESALAIRRARSRSSLKRWARTSSGSPATGRTGWSTRPPGRSSWRPSRTTAPRPPKRVVGGGSSGALAPVR
jgi:hypothetical protein